MRMMKRFDTYLSRLCEVLGHADRDAPMREYCTGLMLPLKRKSVEPIAAHIGPQAVSAKHQSLLHFVGNSSWPDEAMLRSVHDYVMERVPKAGRKGWVLVVDDTGHPKQGRDSVGVARQYCGMLGKTDNCQVAVSVSKANALMSLPLAYRLYLPQEWVKDAPRRKATKVPAEVGFATKEFWQWHVELQGTPTPHIKAPLKCPLLCATGAPMIAQSEHSRADTCRRHSCANALRQFASSLATTH